MSSLSNPVLFITTRSRVAFSKFVNDDQNENTRYRNYFSNLLSYYHDMFSS